MNNRDIKRIAVFTSGGDAPGMNAAIRAVVRTGIYHGLEVLGIHRGYEGMIEGKIRQLDKKAVGNIMHRGGTVLKTARSQEFRTKEGRAKAYEQLKAHNIDACVAIGGNGTYTGAKIFSEEYDIPMVGIPGTIDNDIFGTDFTIGFDTAVNTAIEAVDRIRDTADSHNRLFFIEVMGRHSGYIALHTGIGSGAGNIFLPERKMSAQELIAKLKSSNRKKLFNMVIVAEGNPSGSANELAKIVQESNKEYDVKVTVLGHLQRGGSPTCADRVLASRLGYEAVLALQQGKSQVAIGIVNDHINYCPFDDAINKSKQPEDKMIDMAEILAM